MYSKTLFIFLFLCFSIVSSEEIYRKIIHNTDSEAKCLDGSPGALYIRQGIEKNKFLIYMIGGGFCGQATLNETLESCYQRSKTMFGSSNLWPDTIDYKFGAQGIMALNETLYQNWTKILFAYCDGALHQGDSIIPISYKGVQLYFRGARIVRSHIQWLNDKYEMNKASKIILTGGSAGGLGAFLWGNYLQSVVNNPNSVYIVPDSGIFLQAGTYGEGKPLISMQISNLMKLAHRSQKTPLAECNKKYEGQEWKCLFISEASSFLIGKYLFINSQYDSWAIAYILKMSCMIEDKKGQFTFDKCSTEEMNYIEAYRSLYMKTVNQQIRRAGHGIWSIACSNHVYTLKDQFYNADDERVPGVTGITVKQAISQFVFQGKVTWTYDQVSWPQNQNCAY